ncbi:GNAT superfamily N-acetyltransferase [Pseudomonas sp. BIGb0408]|uniref:GNAT superfamily N-acetyltransferase n=1 Tax=Phytopseudomonas flavescens TaxID=29435 RepID=A0A7Y9XPB4_9GAMM|nr:MULTISPECIES: GNAT family N-acetyltransferase [Pseudomonas]MCW2290432.1 GNAT superfamily N-acetyltransferase [Pseudomonas sp. BIGb0408]NYH74995.1 GNAT superfamily N-acetyltransferase [Pseudomonas flavescens]
MIRSALPNDAKAIASVHIRSWQQAYAELLPSEYLGSLDSALAMREAFWARAIETGRETILVAELDEQVVGWISVGASRDSDAVAGVTGEVLAIYVLAEQWGSGVGLVLWEAGLQRLADHGYRQLTLWVLAANARARRFYRKAGWVAQAQHARSLERGGVKLEEIRYGWPVRRCNP